MKGYGNLRRMIELSNSVVKKCYNGNPDDAENIIDYVQQEALKIGSVKKDNMVPVSTVIHEAIDHCEMIAQNKGLSGITTGYYMIDSLTCGFQPSDLIILAARPAMGKTALAINCAKNAAKKGFVSDFYSLEMARLQLANRLLSVESGVNSLKFRSGKFTQEDWHKITEAASRLYEYKINIDDSASSSYQDIQRKARKSKKNNETDIIWIDYLGFLDGDKGSSKVQEIESITHGLKALAKELNIPIVLLSQLNRQCEQRPNKRPVLSDLRDSGAIEQDADLVMFLYRDEVYNKAEDNPNKGIAELCIAKQRNGPTGTIRLQWTEKTTRFENLRDD
jgi:replicative DNA helicase